MQVGLQELAEHFLYGNNLVIAGLTHDQRSVFHNAVVIVEEIRQLLEHLEMSAEFRLVQEVLLCRLPHGRRKGGEETLFVDRLVPQCEVTHSGIVLHVLSVGLDRRPNGVFRDRTVRAEKSGAQINTCDQSFEVPFPGAGTGLVEIVDAEYQVAFGRSEGAEIRKMGVAARLYLD